MEEEEKAAGEERASFLMEKGDIFLHMCTPLPHDFQNLVFFFTFATLVQKLRWNHVFIFSLLRVSRY